MLYLRIIAILIVESLNYITDGTGDQFNDLSGKKNKKPTTKKHDTLGLKSQCSGMSRKLKF